FRLARRGLAPSAGLVAATLAPEPAAAVTTELLASTIGAATQFEAGRAIAAVAISAAAAALGGGTLRSINMTALKFAAVVLTAAGIIASGGGVLAYQTLGNQPAGAALDPRTKADPQIKRYTDKGKASLPEPVVGDAKDGPGSDLNQAV